MSEYGKDEQGAPGRETQAQALEDLDELRA